MAYRDDLEAAHARIEALEAQLAAVGVAADDAQGLIARSADLEHRIEQLQTQVEQTVADYRRLAQAMREASPDLPTLNEYNRSTPPGPNALSGKPSGVRCPMCLLLFGDSVQMRIKGTLRQVLWQDGTIGATDQTVRCPRCDHLGVKIG